jgi:peptide deformylase
MAVREIVQIGHPVLRKHSSKITHFDGALEKLADDMLETMHEANGAGLAAPQVGVSRRLIVVEMPEDDSYAHSGEQWVVCNPEIIKASRETEVGQEGCLSVSGYVGLVERPVEVIVRGQNLHGRKIRVKADGFLARAFQHEIDHLDGVLYVDRAENDSVMTVEAFEELAQAQMDEDEAPEHPVP